ncbi:hypothetical protein Trco_004494 [Trichoderma cornu-damae]|uniref:DUF1868 domain-containing protein n=1 Tax=Trichoderma cornu-damae TaxID=654480 RepID=A0A9P8TU77_9HYPO|nr:hypothetical protein Trco_004494 [Trichoderma cornu-damae]
MVTCSSNDTKAKANKTNAPGSVHAETARWTGKKFNGKGQVLPFPGNTIICHLPLVSALHKALLPIHERLQSSRFTEFYALLPPSSWHMTIFEGVCDQMRKPGIWPKDLPLDAPLARCNDLFSDKLSKFDLGLQTPLRIAVTGLVMSKSGIRLDLAPVDAAEERRLRGLRDRLSELLQIRAPGHDTYVFHLALAYRFVPLGPRDEEALSVLLQECRLAIPNDFQLGEPEFCHFDDMFAFRRQFFLKGAT